MRVLIYSTKFYPFKGGLENFVLELSKQLTFNDVEVDVVTFNLNSSPSNEKVGQINVYRYDCWKVLPNVYSLPKRSKINKNINNMLKSKKYDFVITNTRFFYSSYMGAKFAKKHNIKHIHIEHGNVFPKLSNPLIWFINRVYEYTLGKFVFKNSNWTIGISQKCTDFAKRMGAKNVSTIYNSINVIDFNNTVETFHTDFTIVFVGRLIEGKGVQDLIKAVKGLNVKLLIVGDGPYKKKLMDFAVKENVNCNFCGEQSLIGVKSFLSQADLFVNPSYSEGLPTSILEAGAMELPVIATNVGGTSEIINNGKNGLLFSPKDYNELRGIITYLINNKSLCKMFGQNLKNDVIEKFDWSLNGEKFVLLLRWINDEIYQ